MPELPEVENMKLSLEALGVPGQVFKAVELRRANLRTPLGPELVARLPGQILRGIERRAKFLLFETQDYYIVNHLGMTGSWRTHERSEDMQKHDHVVFRFVSGLALVFNDPRRFGLLELVRKSETHPWLRQLGFEPLSPEFTGEALFAATRGIKAPIKGFLMDQKRVVGVGNIYASEALFAAGVRPTRAAGRITRAEAESLVREIRRILQIAIAAGGSTIRDYRNSRGESGSFQDRFLVYDRAGEPCARCQRPLKSKFIAGRNTYWCTRCQR